MGCDIHAYIEYQNKGGRWENVQGVWTAKRGARFGHKYDESTSGYLDRDYRMFGLLAGVRIPELVRHEPRGIPEGLASRTFDAYALNVDDEHLAKYPDSEYAVSNAKADSWVRSGSSHEIVRLNYQGEPVNSRYISGPDWHTASWLTSHEFAEILRTYNELARTEWHEADLRHYRAEVAKGGPFADLAQYHLTELESDDYRPGYDVEYAAMLGAMVACEEHGHRSRLVFWFDN